MNKTDILTPKEIEDKAKKQSKQREIFIWMLTGATIVAVIFFSGAFYERRANKPIPGPESCILALDKTAKALETYQDSLAAALSNTSPEETVSIAEIREASKSCRGAVNGHKGIRVEEQTNEN